MRFHGIERLAEGEIDVAGWGGKFNLPDVNAALGLTQLPRLESFNARRRALAAHYHKHLPVHPCLAPPAAGPGHNWHIFTVRLDFTRLGLSRYAFQQRLAARDIATGMHYPAIHLFEYYQRLGYRRGQLPNAETIGAQTLTLPLFPAMTAADVERVCAALAATLEESGR